MKFHEGINPEPVQAKIICKSSDNHQRLFYSVVIEPWTNVTPEGDTHGHKMTAEEIEKSAHYYMEMGSTVCKQHENKIEANVVESYIAPVDFSITGDTEDLITKGSWVMAVRVLDDDAWDKILKGEITAFSPGGYGNLTDLEDN